MWAKARVMAPAWVMAEAWAMGIGAGEQTEEITGPAEEVPLHARN